jgi:hypothetical protein
MIGVMIDGLTYEVPFIDVVRKADVLDKYAERTADGVLHREVVGVYYNYEINWGTTENMDEYNRLWDKLTEPTAFHEITVPGSNGNYTYTGYISSVADKLRRTLNGVNYWSGLTAHFIAQAPARS